MNATTSLQIPASRFDDAIHEVWMSAASRRKASREARAAASMSGCTNHFTGEGAALNNANASSSFGSGSGGGGQVLVGPDTCSTSGFSGGGLVIDVSFGDERDV
jgi:hypothetical protein